MFNIVFIIEQYVQQCVQHPALCGYCITFLIWQRLITALSDAPVLTNHLFCFGIVHAIYSAVNNYTSISIWVIFHVPLPLFFSPSDL